MGKITVNIADEDQSNSLDEVMNLKKKSTKKSQQKKGKEDILKSLYALLKDREKVLNAFKSGYFHFHQLAQVRAGNTSESLLNEICQIIYFIYRAKGIIIKAYNNI